MEKDAERGLARVGLPVIATVLRLLRRTVPTRRGTRPLTPAEGAAGVGGAPEGHGAGG